MVLVAVSIHAKSMHRVTATGSCISVKTRSDIPNTERLALAGHPRAGTRNAGYSQMLARNRAGKEYAERVTRSEYGQNSPPPCKNDARYSNGYRGSLITRLGNTKALTIFMGRIQLVKAVRKGTLDSRLQPLLPLAK